MSHQDALQKHKKKKIIIFYQSLPEKNQRLLEINKLFNEDYSCDVLYT